PSEQVSIAIPLSAGNVVFYTTVVEKESPVLENANYAVRRVGCGLDVNRDLHPFAFVRGGYEVIRAFQGRRHSQVSFFSVIRANARVTSCTLAHEEGANLFDIVVVV